MDDLDTILETFREQVEANLADLAGANGNLEIQTGELGLMLISAITGLAYKMGSTTENIKLVFEQCMQMMLAKEKEDNTPKIIC